MPCSNQGTCIETPDDDYRCNCPASWTGKDCKQVADESLVCEANICANSGICIKDNGVTMCSCPRGFAGERCEIEVNNACDGNRCDEGRCVPGGRDNYTCLCNLGYSGLYCQIDTDECNSNPCRNEGHCKDKLNSFSCTCPLDYTGSMCETFVLPLATAAPLTNLEWEWIVILTILSVLAFVFIIILCACCCLWSRNKKE